MFLPMLCVLLNLACIITIYLNIRLELYVLLTVFFIFFFNDPATTELYTLSLHDALPIYKICDD